MKEKLSKVQLPTNQLQLPGELSTYADKLHPGKVCVTGWWVCAAEPVRWKSFYSFNSWHVFCVTTLDNIVRPKSAYQNVLKYLKWWWLFCQTARMKIPHLKDFWSTVFISLMHNETREEKQSCGRYLQLFLAPRRASQQHYQLQPRGVSSILKKYSRQKQMKYMLMGPEDRWSKLLARCTNRNGQEQNEMIMDRWVGWICGWN